MIYVSQIKKWTYFIKLFFEVHKNENYCDIGFHKN